ncbi:MAG: class I SAM-dependent methyltransferase, partial [Parvularculaceae bacterium]|nr:class I SAM-dependent methyltransferase [Parvularculaceae bacterium]
SGGAFSWSARMDGRPSRTAMMTAMARGAHRLLDARPWILDDPFGMMLVGASAREVFDARKGPYTPDMLSDIRAFIAARARFAEDRLESGGFTQYVIVGAGLDSFVWRRPDLLKRMRVFEVDHPLTQAWKRARAAEIGLWPPKDVVYAGCDFEREALGEALTRAGFDWAAPSFFTWTGVTMYISVAASEATLATVARCAAGSEIVFTYTPDPATLDERARFMSRAFATIATAAGEPPVTSFTTPALEDLVRRAGLDLVAHPNADDLAALYFAQRPDALRPYGMERIAAARVR